ncbi:MAG: hypothetical protein Q7J06_01370 [Bacteroidales bacterium]|nr:hypothetical protein [Bacteroidales bacterium]
MARVTYGALITELAGSIGGITFQRNSSGNVARLKPNMPVNPSADQASQQKHLIALVVAWSALSDANKISWNDLAAAHDHVTPWEETKTLNGFQWFISSGLNMKAMFLAPLSTAPAWATINALPDFVLSASAISLLCTWSPPVDVTGFRVHFYATPPLRQSSLKLRKSNFVIRKINITSLTTQELITYYQSQFGVTWSVIYANANCSIIVRAKLIEESSGLAGPYSTQLIKIN